MQIKPQDQWSENCQVIPLRESSDWLITGILIYSILVTIQSNVWFKAEKASILKEAIYMSIIDEDNFL